MTTITVLLGTAREDRKSERVARWLTKTIDSKESVTAHLFDVKDAGYVATVPPWGTGGSDKNPTEWKRIVEKSDGFLLIIPEYNRGYPGELKLLLDSLYREYAGKPVLLCGVSSGVFGGSRVVEHIQPVLTELKMQFISPAVYVPKVGDQFKNDEPQDDDFKERVEKSINALIDRTRLLKK